MKPDSSVALAHIKEAMALIPPSAFVTVLIRHAEKEKRTDRERLLTAQGRRDSFAAGELMQGRIVRLLHNPLLRCKHTADELRAGSGCPVMPEEYNGLRNSAHAPDYAKAKPTLKRLETEDGFYHRFVEHISGCDEQVPYPGFIAPFFATVNLIKAMTHNAPKRGLCVGVTHDWIVKVTAAYATGKPVVWESDENTSYLGALFIWHNGRHWQSYHNGKTDRCQPKFTRTLPNFK